MGITKDERGNRYGRLIAIYQVEGKNSRAYWQCECDCGNSHIVSGDKLRQGECNSCGCLQKENRDKIHQDNILFPKMDLDDKRAYLYRKGKLKQTYGLDEQEYRDLLDKQRGICPICNRSLVNPCVDHKHNTEPIQVRSILCTHCNLMLGHSKESPETLRAGARYLEEEEDGSY